MHQKRADLIYIADYKIFIQFEKVRTLYEKPQSEFFVVTNNAALKFPQRTTSKPQSEFFERKPI